MARRELSRHIPVEQRLGNYPSTPEELGVGGKGSLPSRSERDATRRDLLSADSATVWKLQRIFDATPGESLLPEPAPGATLDTRSPLARAAETDGDVRAIISHASSDHVALGLAQSFGPHKEAEYKRAKALKELGSRADGEFPSTPEEAGLGSRGEKLIWKQGGFEHKKNAGMIGSAGEPHYIMHFLKTVEGWPTGEDKKKD